MSNEARLEREARETFLGRLGIREGRNVAKVEVSWYYEDPGLGLHELTRIEEHAGYFLVHATGAEEGAETIYDTFEELVHEAMNAKQQREGFADWQIDDTYAA